MNIRDFEGHSPVIHETAFIDPAAVVLGDIHIGADSSVWPMVIARADINAIRIGAMTNIQDGAVLHVTHDSRFNEGGESLTIGDGVTVGHKAILHGCTVGNYCLIGMGAVVMDGAVVQDGAMIGAGSMVTPGKVLEGGFLWLGSPARKTRPLTDSEKEYLKYSAEHYARLARRHRESL